MEREYKLNLFDGDKTNVNNYVGSVKFSAMEDKAGAVARMEFGARAQYWQGEGVNAELQYSYELA